MGKLLDNVSKICEQVEKWNRDKKSGTQEGYTRIKKPQARNSHLG